MIHELEHVSSRHTSSIFELQSPITNQTPIIGFGIGLCLKLPSGGALCMCAGVLAPPAATETQAIQHTDYGHNTRDVSGKQVQKSGRSQWQSLPLPPDRCRVARYSTLADMGGHGPPPFLPGCPKAVLVPSWAPPGRPWCAPERFSRCPNISNGFLGRNPMVPWAGLVHCRCALLGGRAMCQADNL